MSATGSDDVAFIDRIHDEFLSAKDPQQLTNAYDKLTAEVYEKGLQSIKCQATESLAVIIRNHVTDDGANFLDVGAGTGLVAKELRKVGFRGEFDSIEPSEGLSAHAMKQNLYRRYYPEYITDTQQCSIRSESYDNITSAGAIVPGHIKYQAITELFRLVKTGGHVFICLRKDYLETEDFRGFPEFVDKLKTDGICEFKQIEIPVYYLDYTGLVFVFKKLR
ncbi:methyltransferase-like protein 27 [Tubulanus polymorphus]|uniref:methyltransferase-like protein 27 n=1 Tax=Tubulanus polymorphus TaxID=672921 RepID=UPI003DA5E9D4